MSDGEDPGNEKFLRELDAQTKPLKDYLARHPVTDDAPGRAPKARIPPIVIGVFHFVISAVVGVVGAVGAISSATGNGTPGIISMADDLFALLCPLIPLARWVTGRELFLGPVVMLMFLSSGIYAIVYSRLFPRSK